MVEPKHDHDEAPAFRTRRVVTGHDASGNSCILSDGDCLVTQTLGHKDFVVSDAWCCDHLPANNDDPKEPCHAPIELEPAPTGNLVRILQFPPDSEYLGKLDGQSIMDKFGSSGTAAFAPSEGAPHPLMHKTNSLDYIIIISGEIYAVMERGETLLKQGDVLVQRGTNHAWSNRSNQPCVLAAVLNGATRLEAEGPA